MSAPWATIAYASTKVPAGATVYVAAGVYTGSFTTNSSGTSSAYITYQATTVDFSQNVNCAQVAANQGNLNTCAQLVGTNNDVWDNNGDYVAIQGFDVSEPAGLVCPYGSCTNGIYTQGNATLIEGNSVHDVLTETCNDYGGAGITPTGTNNEVVGNYVHNIGPYPAACDYVHGIYFNNEGGYAYNNISFNNAGFGIQMWHNPANLAILNNTIFANATGGIVLGTDTSGVDVGDITVANNIVMGNGNASGGENGGISEQGYTGQNTFENNLVYNNGGGGMVLQNGDIGTGTVTSNPQFVNYTGDDTGNYQLLSTSPARSAGTSSGAPTTDFDGNARPQGSPVDIGAYQYVAPAAQ